VTAVTPYGRRHVEELATALPAFAPSVDTASRWGRLMASVFGDGGRLLAAGNGGSAAQAQHLTAELVGRYHQDRPPFSAICLTAETSTLTAVINDYPPAELFARQVQAHGRPGDILVLFSTSGRSPNVVSAALRGRECGLTVLALTGPAPNPLADASHEALCVDAGYTATVQELHLVSLHLMCAALDHELGIDSPRAVSRDAPPDSSVRESGASAPSARVDVSQMHRPVSTPHPASEKPARGPLVIIGDALLDVDVIGTAHRLAPDAPVPVLDDIVEQPRPGGAGLAAQMAARDGHDVILVTGVGDDEAGAALVRLLEQDVRIVALPYDGPTPVKRRVRSGNQSLLRLDTGTRPGRYGDVAAAVAGALDGAGCVLVSDYGRGITALPAVRNLLAGLPNPVPVVWDPHPRGSAPVPGTHLVTPNRTEAAEGAERFGAAPHAQELTGLAAVNADASALVAAWQSRAVAVTLGSAGALLTYGDGAPTVSPAPAVHCVDPCGAGDRFAVTAALELGRGRLPTEAVAAAVHAASAYVAAGGPATLADAATQAGPGISATEVSLPPAAAHAQPDGTDGQVAVLLDSVRATGGTIVAAGGCFDLLHAGHVATLQGARRLGECLVVCINSDASVARLKGPGRPLVPASDRVRVLLALQCVDAVVVFDEDTPEAILERLRPDIWVKGGDYAGADVPEAAVLSRWGGQVVTLAYLAGRSTTLLAATAAGSAGPAPHTHPSTTHPEEMTS
jgi:rfaE bifunctional protein nucleotidyltransferase chain/domain/rfaE bifunctional protein kinase chain/domain